MDRRAVKKATDTMIKNLYPDQDPEASDPNEPKFSPDRCMACGSEEWIYLGNRGSHIGLGKLEHFRCRQCGLDASVEKREPNVHSAS